MKFDEFGTRYFIKLSSSIVLIVLNLIIQLILPRIFSVETYGYYTYNLGIFTSVVVIANLSFSNAVTIKFAKRNYDVGLIYFYLKFNFIIFLLLNITVLIIFKMRFLSLFESQTLFIILLALESSFFSKLLVDVISMYDSLGVVRFPSMVQITFKFILTLIVSIGYYLTFFNLTLLYVSQILFTFIGITILLYFLISNGVIYESKNFIDYYKEFLIFSKPLFVSGILVQVVIIIMNNTLIKFSGSYEVALFGVAWQVNTLVAFIFSPFAELSKREFSITDEISDLRHIFLKNIKFIFLTTSFISIFILMNSKEIINILFGSKYNDAKNVLIIIMIYTIYQSIGQISGAFLLSINKTKLISNISYFSQVLSLVFVYLMLMPNFIYNSPLGAIGISLNYTIVNLISVHIMLYYVSRILLLNIKKLLQYQLLILTLFTFIAFILNLVTIKVNYIFLIIIRGLIYTILFLILGVIKPDYFNININKIIINLLNRQRKETL